MKKLLNSIFVMFFAICMTSIAVQAIESPDSESQSAAQRQSGTIKDFLHWTPERERQVSAHRGGPMPGYPENALETFENATKLGASFVEMDMALTADGVIVLMHDSTLDRTTTCTGLVISITYEDLLKCDLVDNEGSVTAFKVPTLKDTLLWVGGKVVLKLDFKKGVSYARVVEAVRHAGAHNNVMLISYNLRQARAMHAAGPELMLSVSMYDEAMLADVKASGLPMDQLVAWVGIKLGSKTFYDQLHKHGLYINMGTLGPKHRSIDGKIERAGDDSEYLRIFDLGVDIMSTDRVYAVTKVISKP